MYLRQLSNGNLQSEATEAPLSRGELGAFLGKAPAGDYLVLPERHDKFGTVAAPAGTLGVPSTIQGPPSEVLVDGTIVDPDFLDAYSIELVAGETYLFSVYGSGDTPLGDTFLYLFDDAFTLIGEDDDGGAGVNSLLTFTAAVSGTYYIGVGSYPGSGLTGDYTLDVEQSAGVDVVPDTFGGNPALSVGTVTYGFIDAGPDGPYGFGFGEVDTYSFTAEGGLFYSFEVAGGADYMSDWFDLPPGELDTIIVVYDSNGFVVASNDDIAFPSDISSRVSFFAEEDAVYYVDVFSYQPYSGGYSITTSSINPADYNILDSLNWASANNVQFDECNTAYVYFAAPGENFGQTADDGGPMISLGWNAWEIQQVMEALEEYEKILGVNYEITNNPDEATFRLITAESEAYGAYFFPQDPAFGADQGIGVFNVLSGGWDFDMQQSLVQGGYSFGVILHEFGHAHGLAHPHDNGGGSDIMLGVTGPFDSLGIYDLNQGVYTVMTYNDAWQLHPDGPSPYTAAGVDNGWVGTLSALDIAALQERYGVINPHAAGNTTYTLKDANEEGTYYETIWDTGGKDTIRYDGARNARIDLLAATIDYSPTGGGVLSFVDDIWGGFTIARGVVIEIARGGSGDDALLGNSADNELYGNGGDDILVGREGGDKLDGGGGFDTASYITAADGVKASLHTGKGTQGDAKHDTYKNIEALQGSNFNDKLDGSKNADTLSGMDGDDQLDGGDGKDTLDGGAGDDELDGGKGNDILAGGDGDDGLDGGDDKDVLDGGLGDDVIDGGKGNDVLAGGDGVDVLRGGKDNDTLTGGAGNDTLYGEEGSDVFVFALGSGQDRIFDFSKGQDRIDLNDLNLVWGDLDTNGNNKLDDGDAFVAVSGGDTYIDLSGVIGGTSGVDTLRIDDVINLKQDSFLL